MYAFIGNLQSSPYYYGVLQGEVLGEAMVLALVWGLVAFVVVVAVASLRASYMVKRMFLGDFFQEALTELSAVVDAELKKREVSAEVATATSVVNLAISLGWTPKVYPWTDQDFLASAKEANEYFGQALQAQAVCKLAIQLGAFFPLPACGDEWIARAKSVNADFPSIESELSRLARADFWHSVAIKASTKPVTGHLIQTEIDGSMSKTPWANYRPQSVMEGDVNAAAGPVVADPWQDLKAVIGEIKVATTKPAPRRAFAEEPVSVTHVEKLLAPRVRKSCVQVVARGKRELLVVVSTPKGMAPGPSGVVFKQQAKTVKAILQKANIPFTHKGGGTLAIRW